MSFMRLGRSCYRSPWLLPVPLRLSRALSTCASFSYRSKAEYPVGHNLGQLNIARLKYPKDDERVGDFFAALDKVNAVADKSNGFVWRLKDGGGDATSFQIEAEDPSALSTLSVWENPESLIRYTFKSVHKLYFKRRSEWFKPSQVDFVMWWIPEGEIPTLAEAKERLHLLREHGPSEKAFGWGSLPGELREEVSLSRQNHA